MHVNRTGGERSFSDLIKTDERNGMILVPDDGSPFREIETEDVQAKFLKAEARLRPGVPVKLRERIVTARNIAVYGWFCYELYAV